MRLAEGRASATECLDLSALRDLLVLPVTSELLCLHLTFMSKKNEDQNQKICSPSQLCYVIWVHGDCASLISYPSLRASTTPVPAEEEDLAPPIILAKADGTKNGLLTQVKPIQSSLPGVPVPESIRDNHPCGTPELG